MSIAETTRPYRTERNRRSERRHETRAKTVRMKFRKSTPDIGARIYSLKEHPAPMAGGPKTRGECLSYRRQPDGTVGPCGYISCKHNLYLDVNERNGSIKFNFPDLEPWEMKTSCVLDVADRAHVRGPTPHEDIGAYLNITRTRALQLEAMAIKGIRRLQSKRIKEIEAAYRLDGTPGTAKARVRLKVIK